MIIDPFAYPCKEPPRKLSSCGQRIRWFYAETSQKCFQKIDDTCPGFNRFATKHECEYRCIIKRQRDRLPGVEYGQETEYYDDEIGDPVIAQDSDDGEAYPDETYEDYGGEINYPIDVERSLEEAVPEDDHEMPIEQSGKGLTDSAEGVAYYEVKIDQKRRFGITLSFLQGDASNTDETNTGFFFTDENGQSSEDSAELTFIDDQGGQSGEVRILLSC